MNMNFGIQTNKWSHIGALAERIGLILFLLTFWLPLGFFLGGDPLFLGVFQPALEVVFPLAGVGIFFVFFGQYIAHRERILSPRAILTVLLFLGYGAVSAIFSFQPETSMLFLILWTTGFLAMGTGETCYIEGKLKRWVFFASVLCGFLVSLIFPQIGVPSAILAIASIWGIVFAFKEQSFAGRPILLLFYAWILFSTGPFALVLFAFLLIFSSKIWLQAVSKGKQRRDILLMTFFLLFLIIWGLVTHYFSFSLSGLWLHSFFSNGKDILLGVGEGQFLIASQNFASMVLVPDALHLTPSALLLTLFEKGILGLVLLIGIVFLPFTVSDKKPLLPSILTIFFLLLLPDLVATEQGILFFFPFLFAEKMNGKILNFG